MFGRIGNVAASRNGHCGSKEKMSIELDTEFHRMQYNQQGFTLLPGRVRCHFIKFMAQMIVAATSSTLMDGDESDHSWKEINIQPVISLAELLVDVDLPKIIGFEPVSMVQWLNVYEEGGFIDTHVDAGGDSQILIPLELPEPSQGGLLWIGEKDETLPIGIGDILIFEAHRLRHGTTPLLTGRRVSFNGRLWLTENSDQVLEIST